MSTKSISEYFIVQGGWDPALQFCPCCSTGKETATNTSPPFHPAVPLVQGIISSSSRLCGHCSFLPSTCPLHFPSTGHLPVPRGSAILGCFPLSLSAQSEEMRCYGLGAKCSRRDAVLAKGQKIMPTKLGRCKLYHRWIWEPCQPGWVGSKSLPKIR